MVAMTMITEEIIMARKEDAHQYLTTPDENCGRFLVLSIGTGLRSEEEQYTAETCSRWGKIGWVRKRGMVPITDFFMAASSDLVDIHVATKFKLYRSESNYLRLQDNTLGGTAAAVDAATPENMGDLVGTGENLLRQQVSRVNVDTGKYEVVPGERTNAQALADLARQLSEERTTRLRQGKAVPGRGVCAAR
jgi:hypothetical protein